MNELRKGLPALPGRMRGLPINEKGYPVPWFVQWVEGKPDFRVMDSKKWVRAVNEKRCWCCGEKLGVHFTFVAGPMCGVNRTSAEPPLHLDCAVFSATACPFLTLPKAQRREANMPTESRVPGGSMIKRNPGVAMLWTTRSYTPFKDGMGGVLLRMGDPESIRWFAEGITATRAQIDESVRTGLPFLQSVADEEGPAARAELQRYVDRFTALLPEAS